MATIDQTQDLYIVYFGRPADPEGLKFWTTGGNAALPPEAIANLFAANPEFKDTTAGKTTAQIINSFYVNCFSRDADPTGLEYWVQKVNTGQISIQDVGLYISLGALVQPVGSPDRVKLESKIAAANRYTSLVAADTTAIIDYNGSIANIYGVEYLKPVVSAATIPSVAATQIAIDGLPPAGTQGLLSSSAAQVTEGTGVTFTITTIPSLAGQFISYKLEGVDSADIVGGVLAGTVLVGSDGVAFLNVSIAQDAIVETGNVLKISFPQGSIFPKPPGSDSVVLIDTTVPPTPDSSFILTDKQDIVSGTAVPLFSFIGNEETLGQGDRLSLGLAEEAILDIDVAGKFNLKNFSTSGVQTLLINGDGVEANGDSFVAMSNTDISNIEISRAVQEFVLFNDLQTSDLNVLIRDSNGEYEFNYDSSELNSDADVANVVLDEIPIDQENQSPVGLSFTQGASPFASLEILSIVSTNTSGDPQTNITNLLEFISVGPALGTLTFTGDTSIEILDDLGDSGNELIELIDASTLDADLTLDYTSDVEGRVAVEGAVGDNTLGLYSYRTPNQGVTSFDVLLQDGDDSVVTDLGSDSIVGAGGNDTIVSTVIGADLGLNSVTIDRDTVNAGEGDNSVVTGAGNDSVVAGSGDDTINTAGVVNSALPDRDIVAAGNGENVVVTGIGDDSVTAGTGNDFIDAGIYVSIFNSPVFLRDSDNDIVNAGSGNNTVLTGIGNDSVVALEGDDSIDVETCTGLGNNTVDAGNGNNTVVAGFGNDSIITGEGNDTIVASSGNNTVRSGGGADVIAIGSGNDGVFGGAGNDTVVMEGKNLDDRDFINGGADVADFISFSEGDRIERSETAGVRNIEGFELLNFGGVVGKRVDLLNGYESDVANIVGELYLLHNDVDEDGLLDAGPVRDVAIAELGLAGFNELVLNIDVLTAAINDFVERLAEVPLYEWTQTDLEILSGFLVDVGVILEAVPQSVASPVNNELQSIRSTLFDLVDTLGDDEFNKIYLNECAAEFLYSDRENYNIALDQALVSSSNDIRNGTEFGIPFQDIKFFTIDAELATSSVTVDATTLQQTDADLNRLGLIFLGQNALVQGGSEERIIVRDTLTSASLVLDYDSLTGPSFNDRDVLQLVDGATFTSNDLTNVEDLDKIVLSSASSLLAQTFDLSITQAFLSNQGGNLDGQFVITADPSLPPLSELILRVSEVDPSDSVTPERILVLKSANLIVRLFDTDTNSFVPLVDAGQYDVEVRDALFFTENNDDLQGTVNDDYFYAFEGGDLNPGDYANGEEGFDTLEFEFGVFNEEPEPDIEFSVAYGGFFANIDLDGPFVNAFGSTLSEQLSNADIQGIEEFIFDPKNNDGVRFNGFNAFGSQIEKIDLFDLDVLKTTPGAGFSSGNDLLFLDDFSRRDDSNLGFGNADLAVFTYDGDDTVVTGYFPDTQIWQDPSAPVFAPLAYNGFGEDGKYWIETGNGDDLIISIGEDSKDGGDTIDSGEGNDTILTVFDNDSILYGSTASLIFAGSGENLVITGTGNDTIDSGSGNDTIKSYGGDNKIDARGGNNYIETETGNDVIIAGNGNNSIDAGDGDNLVDLGDGNNRVRGGSGNDTILTGTGNDTINANGGDNFIRSDQGSNDTVNGNDSVVVGTGNDTVDTGYGNDTVVNTSGNDSIITGFGNDSILFTAVDALGTSDTVIAGAGTDTFSFSISTDTDLAPRQVSPLPLGPGLLPGGPVDINPVLSGIDELVVSISADRTLRLAEAVATQSTAGNGIDVVASATGADVILTAGLILPNANDGGFKVGQSLDAVTNGFYSSATDLGIINSGPALLGFQLRTTTAISNTGGTATQIATRRALANGFLFSDNGLNNNVGAGVVGGSGEDSLTAGTKPVIANSDPESVEKSRGFVSYQGNGGGDAISLSTGLAVADQSLTDAFSEFVRYNTAQDGTKSGEIGQLTTGFDSIVNFDNGGITLNGTTPGLNTTRFDQTGVDFNAFVTVNPNGTSSPIDVQHRGANNLAFRDGGVSIDDITGDKIVVGGSLLAGISGSNGNFLFDLFSVDRGANFGDQEGLFLTNAQGLSDSDITNLSVIVAKSNALAGGITANNNQGGLIVAQGVSYSALYYWVNEAGLSGAQAQVEESELRLLAKVDTNVLAADDFLFQATTI